MSDTRHPAALPPLASPKIRPCHLDRDAVVYVRQSTPQQVAEHSESTDRQYALGARAAALLLIEAAQQEVHPPVEGLVRVLTRLKACGTLALVNDWLRHPFGSPTPGSVLGGECSRMERNTELFLDAP